MNIKDHPINLLSIARYYYKENPITTCGTMYLYNKCYYNTFIYRLITRLIHFRVEKYYKNNKIILQNISAFLKVRT